MGRLQLVLRILLLLRQLLQAIKCWSLRRRMQGEIIREHQFRADGLLAHVRKALRRHDKLNSDPEFLRRKDRFRRN